MRVIHTSDWHLGQELHRFERGAEHEAFLAWLAGQLVELEADALVVTGDVFDAVNPPVAAQAMLYRFLRDVSSRAPHLAVVMIGGNHDSAARVELPRPLLDPERVVLVGGLPRAAGEIAPERALTVLRDRRGEPAIACAAIPYLRPADLPPLAQGQSATAEIYGRVLAAARQRAPELPLLMTGHLHVSGCSESGDSERRIVVGGEEAVPIGIFPAQAAYVALGHLHRPQAVGGKAHVRYAGSPFPMSCAERGYTHGIVVADFDRRGLRDVTTVPVPRHVEFLRVPERDAATVAEVAELLRQLDLEDRGEARWPFLEIVVRLDQPEPDMRAKIDAALAGKPVRVTGVRRHDDGSRSAGLDAALPTLEELSPEIVFARCYQRVFPGAAPPAELVEAFDRLLAAVRGAEHAEPGG